MSGLPPEVYAKAELSPPEDLILAILREDLWNVPIQSLISQSPTFPFVLVRRSPMYGIRDYSGDPRFMDAAGIEIHTFTQDPNGDEDGAILSEAVRVCMRDAWLKHRVVPGRGHITYCEMTAAPRRAPDWATATGPVQYADLPTGVWRYQTEYLVEIRKPPTLTLL